MRLPYFSVKMYLFWMADEIIEEWLIVKTQNKSVNPVFFLKHWDYDWYFKAFELFENTRRSFSSEENIQTIVMF